MHKPFTQGWADAFQQAINGNEAYRAAGSGWTWPLALSLSADPARGYPQDVAIELDLANGHCSAVRVKVGEKATTDFVLRGDYAAWEQVVRGTLDPVVAVTMGKLKLVQGSLTTLMMQTKAAKALVACAQLVETDFGS
ncbi:MAG: SCP2 sterol-binding domain-containing protein [Gemmatimonadaceae bacterium]|nr:SCP2 sterol-binding domain-containing protein [Gemmatimonadaceae bacterium]